MLKLRDFFGMALVTAIKAASIHFHLPRSFSQMAKLNSFHFIRCTTSYLYWTQALLSFSLAAGILVFMDPKLQSSCILPLPPFLYFISNPLQARKIHDSIHLENPRGIDTKLAHENHSL